MTDTKEFNKSLDRIAKALGGEEWSPEDKPEAMYKLLDKIADKLEENGGSGGASEPIVITGTFNERAYLTLDKTWQEIYDNFLAGKTQIVKQIDLNDQEYYSVINKYGYLVGVEEKIPIDSGVDPEFVVSYLNYNGQPVTVRADSKDSYPQGDFS